MHVYTWYARYHSSGGLWILTRERVAPAETISAARDAATAAGFDLTVLHPVTQAGCTYQGFPA